MVLRPQNPFFWSFRMLPKTEYRPRGEPLAETDSLWLRRVVESIGDVEASRVIGLSRPTISRCLAGRPVIYGTRCAIADARREHDRAAI
jgi:hypothetical protein